MPLTLNKSELVAVTGGISQSTTEKMSFIGIEFDSRALRGGELFVALAGQQEHGQRYLEQAFARGAAMALVEDDQVLKSCAQPDRVVCVKNTLKAFWDLAKFWRNLVNVPILAITGSVGKTTTKEMAAAILLRTGPGLYTKRSYNNHVGVPYTLCQLTRDHKWAVIEIGMNHPGEIEPLANLVNPDIALVTSVAPAHIENFKGLDEILAEKLSIAHGMKPEGKLVINGDDALLSVHTAERTDTFSAGFNSTADFRILKIDKLGIEGAMFQAEFRGESLTIEIGVLGRHNVLNAALAALGSALLSDKVTSTQIKLGLKCFSSPLNRLALVELAEGRYLIDDSYNANPASMKAMFETARELKGTGKTVGLVLGEMRELGAQSDHLHRECAQELIALQPAFVVGIGQKGGIFTEVCAGAEIPVLNAETLEPVVDYLKKHPVDMLFIKASRAVGLDALVALLLR